MLTVVVETHAFQRSAKQAGMTRAEITEAVDMIAADPTVGDLIVGSGGCRKVRVPGRGKGKSGGYRVVTYYADARYPVFLLYALSKGQRANLSRAQTNALARTTETLVTSLTRQTT